MMPATIAGPRDGRGDRKAFAGSRAKDTRDAKKTDPGHLKDSHLDTAKVFGDRQGHPTGHLRGIPAVDGYQGPTEIPAGADDERDFEAEAALAAKVTAEDAHAAPLALSRASFAREPAKAFLSPRRSLGPAIIAGVTGSESAVPFRATVPLRAIVPLSPSEAGVSLSMKLTSVSCPPCGRQR
jgi:hypothetical protein